MIMCQDEWYKLSSLKVQIKEEISVDQNNTSQILIGYKSPDKVDQDGALRVWDTVFLLSNKVPGEANSACLADPWEDSDWFGGTTWVLHEKFNRKD